MIKYWSDREWKRNKNQLADSKSVWRVYMQFSLTD